MSLSKPMLWCLTTILCYISMACAELYECENAVADLTGRAHYCDALYSRGLCHLTLENFEKAFDDILRADALDNRIGEYVLGSLEIAAAIDPGHPRVQKSAELCAALKRRKMNSLKAVDDNSCWERRTFDQKMTTIVTLVRMGDHHRATINLNEVIKHLDPFSPNIREQSEAVNQLNTMLHESAVAAHDPTLAANNKSGSAATNRADTSVSCKMCLEHNESKTSPSGSCTWMEACPCVLFACLHSLRNNGTGQAIIESDAAYARPCYGGLFDLLG
ncbi:TPA: hypothetical protein ACH3X1_004718 [Trebouxia sp. C0004]